MRAPRRMLQTAGKSLLPIGMVAVEGEFSRGEVIAVRNPEGQEMAPAAWPIYSSAEARPAVQAQLQRDRPAAGLQRRAGDACTATIWCCCTEKYTINGIFQRHNSANSYQKNGWILSQSQPFF